MATYHIDPSLGSNGTGTAASPYNTWTGVPTGAGNIYKQKRGTTFTGAFPGLTAGTAENVTTVAAYFNVDGTDDATQPKPIIDLGNNASIGARDYFKYMDVEIRNNKTAASDTPIMYMGNDSTLERCKLVTNLTAIYVIGKSRVTIKDCHITGATVASTSVSCNVIAMADNAAMDNILIENNTIFVGNGGNTNSHGVLIESYANTVTNLVVRGNTINTTTGVLTTVATKIGLRIVKTPNALVQRNTITNMLSGVFASGSVGVKIRNNVLNNNGNFGVHVTGNTSGFDIRNNTCRRNGTSLANGMPYYGRGIELSGGGLKHNCTRHVVAFNDCSFSVNYGGPSDNATEGVGIGLDDAASFCLVFGNLLYKNEGSGVQVYGAQDPNNTDRGGNIIVNNHFIDNATYCKRNRRSGTEYLTTSAAHVTLAYTFGSRTTVANNLFIGSFGGIREEANCNNVEKYNNVFIGQTSFAIALASIYNVQNNIYKPGGTAKQIANLTTDVNLVPTPGLISTGHSSDRNIDPRLNSRYEALSDSVLLDTTWRKNLAWTTIPLIASDA